MDCPMSAIAKTLIPKSSKPLLVFRHHVSNPRCFLNPLISRRVLLNSFYRSNGLKSVSVARCFYPVVGPARLNISASFASAAAAGGGGGGGGGEGGGFSGGGGDGTDGGDSKGSSVVGGGEEGSVLSSDVIVLDVGGMTCGGCAASVKRILENQPQVFSASVNLTTETAIVWPVSEAKIVANWQKELGETLAKHLTTCGFTSNLRGENAVEGDILS